PISASAPTGRSRPPPRRPRGCGPRCYCHRRRSPRQGARRESPRPSARSPLPHCSTAGGRRCGAFVTGPALMPPSPFGPSPSKAPPPLLEEGGRFDKLSANASGSCLPGSRLPGGRLPGRRGLGLGGLRGRLGGGLLRRSPGGLLVRLALVGLLRRRLLRGGLLRAGLLRAGLGLGLGCVIVIVMIVAAARPVDMAV